MTQADLDREATTEPRNARAEHRKVPFWFRSETSACEERAASAASLVTLSIVVPARNEAQRLPRTLAEIGRFLRQRGIDGEVIVVDDGSTDGTAWVAEHGREHLLRLRVVQHDTPRGKGAAVRTGFREAAAPIVCFVDADLATPLDDLAHLLSAIRDGADIAIGSRHLPQSAILVEQPWHRRALGWLFRCVVSRALPLGVRDTQCGAKAFRRETAQWLTRSSSIDGYAFDLEWLALARRWRRAIREIPIAWADRPGSSLRVLPVLREIGRDVLAIRRRFRG